MADIKSKLLLDNSDFNKKARQSTKLTDGLGKGLAVVGNAAKFTAASVTAAAGGLAFLVTRSTQAIDRLGKVSKTTGFAAETLQKFQFAAEQSGVTADNAALALRRFSRRLGEAQRSTGELLPALKKLGIETRKSDGTFKSAEEVLFEFADGITTARNESEQLSLAFKAFDSEGAELVETLKDGADGLQAFFNEAEALGFILTQESIKGVEQFADEFNRLQKIVQGLINQFTAALAPTLEKITKKFRDQITQSIKARGGLEAFGKYLKDEFIKIVAKVIIALEGVFNVLVDIGNAIVTALRLFASLFGVELFPQLAADADKATASVNGLTDTIKGGLIGALLNLPQLKPFLVAAGLGTDVVEEFAKSVGNITSGPQLFERTTKGTSFANMLLGDLEENKKAAEETVEMIEEVVVRGQNKIGETILGKVFGVGRVKEFWDNWYAAGTDALERFKSVAGLILGGELVDKIKDAFANSDIGDFTKTLADGMVKAAGMFEDALAEAFVNGKADFSDLADFIKITLAKAFIQKTITGPLMALFGLASGGPAKAGQPYIVGEEGPELFIPKQSGTVIPNDTTMGIMGAGGPSVGGGRTPSQNITINAVDTQSFKQALARDPEFIYSLTRVGAKRTPG